MKPLLRRFYNENQLYDDCAKRARKTLMENSPSTAVDMAAMISHFVSRAPEDEVLELGKLMALDHRTVVQKKARMVWAFVKELNECYEADYMDARNRAACSWAREVVIKTTALANFPTI